MSETYLNCWGMCTPPEKNEKPASSTNCRWQLGIPIALIIIGIAAYSMGMAGWGEYQNWWSATTHLDYVGSIALITTGAALTFSGIVSIFYLNFTLAKTKTSVENPAPTLFPDTSRVSESPQSYKHPSRFWNLDELEQSPDSFSVNQCQFNRSLRPIRYNVLVSAQKEGSENKKAYPDRSFPKEPPTAAAIQELEKVHDEKPEYAQGKNWGSALLPNAKNRGAPVEDACYVDEFTLTNGTPVRVFGVFDGHGDLGVFSNGAKAFFHQELPTRLNRLKNIDNEIQEMLTQLCLECDMHPLLHQSMSSKPSFQGIGGTTATCALEINDAIYLMNVGDSRAVLFDTQQKKYCQLTEDADPVNERFAEELKQAGVAVWDRRVKGQLAVARDLGINYVSAIPDVTSISKDEQGYLIIATDGFWDVCTNSEALEAVSIMESQGLDPMQMAAQLALRARSVQVRTGFASISYNPDDITVLVVKLG